MPAEPAEHLAFVATERVARLLCGRGDLEFRDEVFRESDLLGSALVRLATPVDEVPGEPRADEVRIAVLSGEPVNFDDTRFDDYVFASASWPEIVFRSRCVLRRKAPAQVRLTPMSLQVRTCTVPLSVTEHRLLARLLEQRDTLVTRADLERAIGEAPTATRADAGRALDAHVYRLRRKLRVVSSIRIETLRQRGFSLSIDDDSHAN